MRLADLTKGSSGTRGRFATLTILHTSPIRTLNAWARNFRTVFGSNTDDRARIRHVLCVGHARFVILAEDGVRRGEGTCARGISLNREPIPIIIENARAGPLRVLCAFRYRPISGIKKKK